jgi:hypothetical protein
MKTAVLNAYYDAAMKVIVKSPNRPSANMVVELCEEVRRLRDLHTARKAKKGEDLDDDCLVGFGQYRDERLADVPDDYLIWWRSKNKIDSLSIDAQFAPDWAKRMIAKKNLKLYEYICKRVGRGEDPASEAGLTAEEGIGEDAEGEGAQFTEGGGIHDPLGNIGITD